MTLRRLAAGDGAPVEATVALALADRAKRRGPLSARLLRAMQRVNVPGVHGTEGSDDE